MKNEKNSASANSQKQAHNSRKNKALTIGSVIILIFSAVTFIFIPAMTDTRGKQLPPFGKYNGKPIKYETGSQFASMVEYYAEQEKNSGNQLDETAYFRLFNNAFSSTVLNMAFTDEVLSSGYLPADKLIDRSMLPYFYDTNGKFSSRIYRDTPDTKKIELRKQISDSLINQRYVQDIFGNNGADTNEPSYGVKSSSAELAFIQNMQKKERSFTMAVFSKADYPVSEATAFGKEHADLFTKLNLSVITVETESEAKKLASRLQKNEIVFADAVNEFSGKQYSDEAGTVTSNFTYQLKNILTTPESLDALEKLAPDAISGEIKTTEGYSVFRCNSAPETADFDNADMQKAVLSYMNVYESGRIEDYFIQTAKDFAAAAVKSGFETACRTFNAESVAVPAFSMNYANSPLLGLLDANAVPALQNADTNENFLKTAFSLKQNEISTPIVHGDNILVLRFDEETDKADDSGSFAYIFPYYTSQFDQMSVQQFFMSSKKLTNNFVNVYFNNFLNNN